MAHQHDNSSGRGLAILCWLLICCFSSAQALVWFNDGDEYDVDFEIEGTVWIDNSIVNLWDGAWIKSNESTGAVGDVCVYDGGVLNIYGGKIDNLILLMPMYTGLPNAEVTVFGRDFAVDGEPLEEGTTELFLEYNLLTGVYEDGTPFAFKVDGFGDDSFNLPINFVWIAATPEIDILPDTVTFGEIEIGQEQIETITIANIGIGSLVIDDIIIVNDSAEQFGLILTEDEEELPLTISPNSSADFDLLYLPSEQGIATADLQVFSNDPNRPVVEVLLTGTGAAPEEPERCAYEQINAICAFYLQGLKDGTIVGDGPGRSGRFRAIALGHQLITARHLIRGGYERFALFVLESVEKKTNGMRRPPDFVAGPAVPELNAMVNELIGDIRAQ